MHYEKTLRLYFYMGKSSLEKVYEDCVCVCVRTQEEVWGFVEDADVGGS